jgi:tetratricopeptide (TPR) repeat protein
MRTEWKTSDIWLRRKFEWKPDPAVRSLMPRVIHDDGFELFVNGQLIVSREDFKTGYTFYPVDLRALGLLKSGTNTLAVHCHSTVGAQYIDLGLRGVSSTPRVTEQRLAAMKIADPWAKLAAAYHVIGDRPALDGLLNHHPAAASGIGDLFAAEQDWKQALAVYNKAITPQCQDGRIFAARAEAHEKLEHWEPAADDWGNADLHAVDKRVRYGNPSLPALERRAKIHGRLQQFDKQVVDYTELLKRERFGENAWFFAGRGEAYDHLRQWDKARADYDQAVKVCQANEREVFQFSRAGHFAAQAQWKLAADELRPLYQNPSETGLEWWRLRNASFNFGMAGDAENCRTTAAACYRKVLTGNLTADDGRWILITMLQSPETITTERRPHLLHVAAKTDAYWQPRLTAAIHFRSGDPAKAAEFFDANGPGPQFLFLAAMTYQKLGKRDRARQLLDEGLSWVRGQRAKDPAAGVPKQYGAWQDWVAEVALQSEASDLIVGPITSEPQKLALQGQLAEAVKAYAKALADAPDQRARSRIMDETAQLDGVWTAVHVFQSDWKGAAASYSSRLEQKPNADTLAWMKAPTLWAYAGDAKRHRESCQKMYERFRTTTDPVDTERCLKTMLALDHGPELPAESVRKFYASFDGIEGETRAWLLVTRAWLECRKGNHAEAHKCVDEALALEMQIQRSTIKALALAIRSLIYAKQKDVAQARKTLDQLKLDMSEVLQMKWKADGLLDGSTILSGASFDHDKLNIEILRREAEQLIKSVTD